MLRGGYGQVTQGLAAGLDVRLGCPVTSIEASESSVMVTSASGNPLRPPHIRLEQKTCWALPHVLQIAITMT